MSAAEKCRAEESRLMQSKRKREKSYAVHVCEGDREWCVVVPSIIEVTCLLFNQFNLDGFELCFHCWVCATCLTK